MPTLKNKKSDSGFCVIWRSHPKANRPSTYQVTNRAVQLFNEMGFTAPSPGDTVEVPHEVCRPLRVLGDLYFTNESNTEPPETDEIQSLESSSSKLSNVQNQLLNDYIQTHPKYGQRKEDIQKDIESTTDRNPSKTNDSEGLNEDSVDYPAKYLFPPDIREEVVKWAEEYVNNLKNIKEKYEKDVLNGQEIPSVQERLENIYSKPGAVDSIQRFVSSQIPLQEVHVSEERGLVFTLKDGIFDSEVTASMMYDYRYVEDFSSEFGMRIFTNSDRGEIAHDIEIESGFVSSWDSKLVVDLKNDTPYTSEDKSRFTDISKDDVVAHDYHLIMKDKAELFPTIEKISKMV